ncbi:MAG: CBO0543 family protein [Bacillota bacterium]
MVILISVAVCLLIFYNLRDWHLKSIEIYSVFFSSLYSALAFDALFKGRYELYYYGSEPGVHYIDFVFRLCFYPLFCLIFLNLFPHKRTRTVKILYFGGCVLFMTLAEWAMVQLSVIQYDGWKLFYSPLKYSLILCLVFLSWVVTTKLAKQLSA